MRRKGENSLHVDGRGQLRLSYLSEKNALRAAKRMDGQSHVYLCPVCKWFHVAKGKPPAVQQPEDVES